ncbi:MAG: leucine-rich repeat protein [Firmicutes bacterium]|nr:leucine-rich repeat protein [Bacillota bacterium]
MSNTETNGTKKGFKFKFKLTKRWIALISVAVSIILLVSTALIVSVAVKNPGVKAFDAYIRAAKAQSVTRMAGTLYEKGSDEYKEFVENYEAGKSQYRAFLRDASSEDMNRYLRAGEDLYNPSDRKDYGLRLAWEETLARNIRNYDYYVAHSDSYYIRVNITVKYNENYSSANMPGKFGSSLVDDEVPYRLELNFRRIGNKWHFAAPFRFLSGSEDMSTWIAPCEGGSEVKKVNPYDIRSTQDVPNGPYIYRYDLTKLADDIVSIGSQAFKGCGERLTELIIPYDLRNIGAEAFKDCPALTKITYPDGTPVVYPDGKPAVGKKEIKVGDAAFYNCEELTFFELSPNENKIIPSYVFFNCAKLEGTASAGKYALADTVTAVGYYAFYGCAKLTDIHLPASLTSIGDGAFENCTALVSLGEYGGGEIVNILDNKITRIGINAFKNSGIRKVTLPNNITDIPFGLFNGCEKLAEVGLPGKLRSIGAYAFTNTGLGGISFPASLEKIGNYAFLNSGIGEVTWDGINKVGGTSIKTLGEYSFNSCNNLVSLQLPDSIRGIGKSAFVGCRNLRNVMVNFPSDIVIPSPTEPEGAIFIMSQGIPKIYVKDNLAGFKSNWFSMNLDIYSQGIIQGDFAIIEESRKDAAGNTLPAEKVLVQYLGAENSPKIPNDIKRIGNGAFAYSKTLKSIDNFAELAPKLTDIGRDVFAGCDNMIFNVYGSAAAGSLNYLGDAREGWLIDGSGIADGVLDLVNRTKYTRRVTEQGVTTTYNLPDTIGIAAAAFDAADLTEALFNKELKYICESAFPRLIEFVAAAFEEGSGLLRIGREAFYSTGLDHIELPEKLVEIDERAFFGCDEMRYIIIKSTTAVKLGGTAIAVRDKDENLIDAYYARGEGVFTIGYDVLKIYINDYDTAQFYKGDLNWLAYKDVLFDSGIIQRTALGDYAITPVGTLIQLLSADLVAFDIPPEAVSIGKGAFAKSTIERVVIHSLVTRIEQYAFYECKKLYSVTFKATGGSDSLLYVGMHAFRDADKLSDADGEIIFEAAAPNEGLQFSEYDPFDVTIYRKILVGIRDNYGRYIDEGREEYVGNKYWADNADMLKAADDPLLTIGLEFLQVTDENKGNTVSPEPGTIDRAPNEKMELVATPDTVNGYHFIGWYDENGNPIDGENYDKPSVTATFGKALDEQTYIARFGRHSAWVRVLIDEDVAGGKIYLDNAELAMNPNPIDDDRFLHGGRLTGCDDYFTLKAECYPEYEFEGWYINHVLVSQNLEYDCKIFYRDVEIEAKFVKMRAWVIITLPTAADGGTATLVSTHDPKNVVTIYDSTGTRAVEIRVLLAEDETVTFKATPSQFFEIDSWHRSGVNLGDNAETHTYVMTGALSNITARVTFIKIKVPVTVTFVGEGTVSAGIGGDGHDDTFTTEISHGSSVTFAANGKPGYKFVEWIVTVGSAAPTKNSDRLLDISIITADHISIVAVFEEADPIRITVNYNAGGTVKLGGSAFTSADIPYSSVIVLKAESETGYWFAGWYVAGGLYSFAAEITVIVEAGVITDYEARFRLIEDATLTITFTEEEENKVFYALPNAVRQEYTAPITEKTGTRLTLTAEYDNKTHVFQGWYTDGNLVSTDEVYVYLISEAGAQTIEARFRKIVSVTALSNDESMGTATVTGDKFMGSAVILTATTEKDEETGEEIYKFVGWYLDGALVSTDESYRVVLTGDVVYEARFAPI